MPGTSSRYHQRDTDSTRRAKTCLAHSSYRPIPLEWYGISANCRLRTKFPIVRTLRNTSSTSSSTITNHLKGIFDEHFIPERLISDNGPQYTSGEFRAFSARYGFDRVTISPLYPRTNGFIERTVQTVKRIFTKAKEGGVDPRLAMLCLRTTPVDHNLPFPCEIINGRSTNQIYLPYHPDRMVM